jgi:hypothetical protein
MEGRKELPPRKETSETGRTDHLPGNNDLFILTSDDNGNFSGTPSKIRTEIIINQNTPLTRTV